MHFIKKDNQAFYNPMRKAIQTYEMIEPGDRVAIGMSGGKDSTSLFLFLETIRRQKRLGFDFEIVPICLTMGFDMEITPIQELVEQFGYQLEIVPTTIAQVVFDIREERSPCSLCAKLRRGYLYTRAHDLNCQKVALGHHLDDAVETYLMNFLFHGKMRSFEPKSYLSKTKVTLIRPMIYVEEQKIIQFVKREAIPIIFNPCPVDKKTKREEIKQVITNLSVDYPTLRQKFILGMEQGDATDFWQPQSE
ncbi:MAG: tRNA 2-thiocytidine biosynthesis TtcA family protein [Enterococcus sp.]